MSLPAYLAMRYPFKCVGERGNFQYGWSTDLRARIVQFSFQLVRSDDHTSLEVVLSDILHTLKGHEEDYFQELVVMYKLIAHTRDIHHGRGEQRLAFMQIWLWYQVYPELAKGMFGLFVEKRGGRRPYGSWKDLKYFCQYIYTRSGTKRHRLIRFALDLAIRGLDEDWKLLGTSRSPSLAGKWMPREKSRKFGWIHTKLAKLTFPHYLRTARTPDSKKRAFLKVKIQFTKRLVALNRRLGTVQIDQCAGRWRYIKFSRITALTLRRQQLALLNKRKTGQVRSTKEDRTVCAAQFIDYLEQAKSSPSQYPIHARGMMVHELVKAALVAAKGSQVVKDIVNLQWADNALGNKPMRNVIPCCDVSTSLEDTQSLGLYTAIGLSIRCAELNQGVFKDRILIFDANPRWINMELCKTFVDKVSLVSSLVSGLNANFYRMLRMVLDACVTAGTSPSEVQNMVLAIFSDMQVDPMWKYGLPSQGVMYDNIVVAYTEAGLHSKWGVPYTPPHVLFWNVRPTTGFPVSSAQRDVTMLSGFSSVLLNVLSDKGGTTRWAKTPYQRLIDLLQAPRYEPVAALLEERYRKANRDVES